MPNKWDKETKEKAVRLVVENRNDYAFRMGGDYHGSRSSRDELRDT